MSHEPSNNRIKVADVDELPPGKGKTATVGGREVTVYNREGRYVATSTAAAKLPSGVLETTCEMPGRHFEVGPAISPDRLQSDEEKITVVVENGAVYVLVAS
jgi:nitrite reductase/ring-hydroxylating ferredoxin subunit